MTRMSRRTFIRQAGGGAAAAGIIAAHARTLDAKPLGLPIGSQTWPHRAMIKDAGLAALAAALAKIGVEAVEMCSPFGYEEFAGLTDGKQVRKILADHGLACQSGHFGMDELRTKQAASIAWAHDVGITQMVTASLDAGDTPTMEDVKRAAAEYNRIAGGRGEGRHPAGPAQRGLRGLAGRRPAHLRHPVRAARSRARQVPVPDVDDQPGLRRGRVLHEVSGPVQLDALAGRRPERRADRARQGNPPANGAWNARSVKAASTGRRRSGPPGPAA